jgi:hypothetical protein
MMNETERLVFITRNFNRLQNLRFAPVYVLLGASPWVSLIPSVSSGLVGAGVCIVLCIAWYWLLNQYYKQSYGRVEEKWNREVWQKRRFAMLPLAVPGLFTWYFLFRGQHTPPEFILLFVPASILVEGLSYPESALRRPCYVAASAVSLLVLLPGLISSMPGHRFFRVYDFPFLAAVLLILSIFDHLLLVRSFRQSSRAICV